jgi:hypothetical protein
MNSNVRKWLRGQHCLWPQMHEDAGLQEKVQVGSEEPYWICKYCTRVHLQFEIMGVDKENPEKYFVRGWQDGKLRAIFGKESRFQPAEAPRLDREFLKNL